MATTLGYCSNVHPGETWAEHFAELRRHLPAVKAMACPHAPMGVGLRLSAGMADALAMPAVFDHLAGFLAEHDLFVFTVNGFVHGAFAGKAQVYRPDWTSQARLDYANALARLLARLLPEGGHGAVSTVPVGWKADAPDPEAAARMLRRHAAFLAALEAETGRTVVAALEPEPGCAAETVAAAVRFLTGRVIGRSDSGTEAVLRRHLGLCLDACHVAIVFEDPDRALAVATAAGIGVAKLQASNALAVPRLDPGCRADLAAFAEGRFLHQAVARTQGQAWAFADLPEALARVPDGAEMRIHCHVPVWAEAMGRLSTTRDVLDRLLARQRAQPFTDAVEVETYTWSVLPERHRPRDLSQALAEELAWIADRLA